MSLQPSAAAVAAPAFREAMSRLSAAVNVVTTDGPAGRAGFTASAVCSVTDSPPTLLVCLNRGSSARPVVQSNGVLCVNTLAADQEEVSRLFGGGTPQAERFSRIDWSTLATGAPVLAGAAVAFDCRIVRSVEVGSHDVLFCEVTDIIHPEEAGALVYFARAYHALGRAPQG